MTATAVVDRKPAQMVFISEGAKMGKEYRLAKRARRLEHVAALLKACNDLNLDLQNSPFGELTAHEASRRGLKRLAALREHITEAAIEQGIGLDHLYEVARYHAPIPPSPGPHPTSRIYRWRNEKKSPRLTPRLQLTSIDTTATSGWTGETASATIDCKPATGMHIENSVAEDSELVDPWQEAFLEAPSDVVAKSLRKLGKKNGSPLIKEAITITAYREHITGSDDRLRYISGILRRKRIEVVLPERAAELHRLDRAMIVLADYWKKQPHGSGYLGRNAVAEWIKYCTIEEIKTVMDVARGYWAELRADMDKLMEHRKCTD